MERICRDPLLKVFERVKEPAGDNFSEPPLQFHQGRLLLPFEKGLVRPAVPCCPGNSHAIQPPTPAVLATRANDAKKAQANATAVVVVANQTKNDSVAAQVLAKANWEKAVKATAAAQQVANNASQVVDTRKKELATA